MLHKPKVQSLLLCGKNVPICFVLPYMEPDFEERCYSQASKQTQQLNIAWDGYSGFSHNELQTLHFHILHFPQTWKMQPDRGRGCEPASPVNSRRAFDSEVRQDVRVQGKTTSNKPESPGGCRHRSLCLFLTWQHLGKWCSLLLRPFS